MNASDKHREQIGRWLVAAQQGPEDAAEAAFTQLFAALPRTEPGVGFAERTAELAWKARVRRRRAMFLARVAAASVVTTLAATGAYFVMAYAAASIATTGVAVATRLLIRPLLAIAGSIEWWSVLASAAATIGDLLATPQSQVALIASELICALAVYALHRLLHMELAESVTVTGDRQ